MGMKTYYLAVDIGASSGRHILSWLEDGKIHLEEIYRFENGMKEQNGHLCWDLDHLFEEIVNGLAICKTIGKIPVSMGIDTWAVDFVLLDHEGRRLGDAVGYRDHRTDGIDRDVYQIIGQDELYARTGIQKQIFNTIYQLMAVKKQTPELLEQAETLLLIPDYFNYRLTGRKMTEYTNATTTQLVNPDTKAWDLELIRKLGYKESIFTPVTMAGTAVGGLKQEIQDRIGFDLEVLQTATHDTASAVLSVPAREKDFLYISSGTWSLMGVEQQEANCSEAARLANLTNEGGYEYRYRFLKNIMGLWMIQSVRHELQDRYSFAELCRMAEACVDFPSRVDVNDERFLSPASMTEQIQAYCRDTDQKIPGTPGELSTVIYQSLAESYGSTVSEIEQITGKTYGSIHIVGGGANADYLNQLTADATGKTIYAGPTEATAIGNLTVQMLKDGVFADVWEARKTIYESFEIKKFEPYQK
jgi:rhamnulokinase